MPLLVSSQTLSTDSICCVPCKALKKALMVKNERDFLKNQIGVTRDSILIFTNILSNQDSIIIKQDTTISLYKKNEDKYNQIIINKDVEIKLKDKQIKKAKNKMRVAWATTGLSIITFILILI